MQSLQMKHKCLGSHNIQTCHILACVLQLNVSDLLLLLFLLSDMSDAVGLICVLSCLSRLATVRTRVDRRALSRFTGTSVFEKFKRTKLREQRMISKEHHLISKWISALMLNQWLHTFPVLYQVFFDVHENNLLCFL